MSMLKFKVLQVHSGAYLNYRTWIRTVEVPTEDAKMVSNETQLLELIFRYGQNDFQPKKSPSVSIGDVAVIGEKYFLCESLGWKEIETVA